MNRLAAGILGLACYGGSYVAVAQAPPIVVDDVGREVHLQQPAQRIITLAPHATENAFAAGAGDAVVGRSAFSDFPAAAQALPILSGYRGIDIERVLRLRPDLVVVWQTGGSTRQIDHLIKLGIPLYISEPRSLSAIADNLRDMGLLAGVSERAEAAAEGFLDEVARLRAQYRRVRRLSVFYQIWAAPVSTINGAHLATELLNLCGATNVFANLPVLAGPVSMEAILKLDPDAIVLSADESSAADWMQRWQRWPSLRAVRAGALVVIDADLSSRHTTRVVEGINALCIALDRARAQYELGQ